MNLSTHIIELLIIIYTYLFKFYFWIEKRKKIVLNIMFFIALFGTFFIYSHYYDFPFDKSIYYSLTQFTGDVKTPVEIGLDKNSTSFSLAQVKELKEHYHWLYWSAGLAFLTSFLTILLLFFKESIRRLQVKNLMQTKAYTLIIGLGENHKVYLESELKNKKIVIIEKDPSNIYIQHFEQQGVGVLVGVLDDYKESIKKVFPENIFISVGNDRHNIELATQLEDIYRQKNSKEKSRIFIHLDNQNFETMFQQRILSKEKETENLEFRPYSFYDDVARYLWMHHTVIGDHEYKFDTQQSFTVVIVGTGYLAERVLYYLYMLAHFPNENQFKIVCIGNNASSFGEYIWADLSNLGKISNITLECLDIDEYTKAFYDLDIWKSSALTNVILCDDDENINLKQAVNLYDKVFFREAKQNHMKVKVLIAMYHSLSLGEMINYNKDEFKNFHTFGNVEEVCSKEYLVNETQEQLARIIHYGYGDIYDIEHKKFFDYINIKSNIKKNIEQKWHDTTKYSDRESNRSQALHIDSKLMALGLRKKKILDGKIDKSLLQSNIEIFNTYIERDTFPIGDEEILYVSNQLDAFYSECSFDDVKVEAFYENIIKSNSKVSKLLKSEHARWNAFHYLNGWQYAEKKDKDIKIHNCLTKLENFSDIGRKITLIYDLYSVLYIPSYLASIGYQILPVQVEHDEENNVNAEKLIIGITGHRDLSGLDAKFKTILQEELYKFLEKYDSIELVSPLAEGADRLFVDSFVEVVPNKIKTIKIFMPFSKEEYMKDFTKLESKNIFLNYFEPIFYKNLNDIKIETIEFFDNSISREEAYKRVGECIVKEVDLLVALWDGKPANGIGGTGDIVAYAKEYNKPLLYINTYTLKVKRENFKELI